MLNQDRLIQTFFDLVKIDSPTGGERGVADYLIAQLKRLGFETRIDATLNVTAFLPGRGDVTSPLLLSAHMDSVPPCHGIQPRIEAGIIKSDGTTILGGDDRAAVASILEALTVMHEQALPHRPLEIAFTAQEEPGLLGSAVLDYSQFKSKWGVVFDYDGPVGKIIVSAPATYNLDATITGRAAHAGAVPEKGISAILVATEAIGAMKLGRLDYETTANVGMIRGGLARNIVPETCELTAETRSRRQSKLERQKKAMVRALERAAKKHRAHVDIRLRFAYPAYRIPARAPIVRLVSDAVARVGRTPQLDVAGGGSDANQFNAHGIQSIVTSIGIEKMHSTQEFIPVGELVKCAELVFELVKA
jgi:tripeptide aminopeptidase